MPDTTQIIDSMISGGWLKWSEKETPKGTLFIAKLPAPAGSLHYEVVPSGTVGYVGTSLSFVPAKPKTKGKSKDKKDPPEILLFGPGGQPSRYSQQWRVINGIEAPPADAEGRLDPYIRTCLENLVSNHFSRDRFASLKKANNLLGVARRSFMTQSMKLLDDDFVEKEVNRYRHSGTSLDPDDLHYAAKGAQQLSHQVLAALGGRPFRGRPALSAILDGRRRRKIQEAIEGDLKPLVKRWAYEALADIYLDHPDDPVIADAMAAIRRVLG